MKKIKIAGIVFALALVAAASVYLIWNNTAEASGDTVIFHGGASYATINGEKVALDGEIIDVGGCLYVASDKPLIALGFNLGWKDDIKSVIAIKNNVTSYIVTDSTTLWKGPDKYTSPNKTMLYKNVFYIPLDMFAHLTDADISTEGEIAKVVFNRRDLLTDTVVGDTHRLSGPTAQYGGVYIAGDYAMEKVSIPETSAQNYAAIINMFGDALPKSVGIYNIVVPTSSEFYGPSNVYCNQTEGIKTVYKNLSERIIPINAVKPLYEHAGESIYFRTDHHWTQRGAYYAYKELMDVKGETAPPLSDFPLKTGTYTGSFASFARGTAGEGIIKSKPDTIEIFAAPKFISGASYNDMYMKSFNRSVSAVYQSTSSYMAYLGGDNPLTVLTGSAGNGKKAVVIKESFGNAFAPWLLNNYSEVYVVDVRKFNTAGQRFKIKEFYDFIKFDDLIIINYPVSVSSSGIRTHLLNFI
ncbi:MAG: hypothetical protein E7415_05280 [Ruminococcaceae bacterium]|nr:hypothetical protein [Oscillospiraceae bacterium]